MWSNQRKRSNPLSPKSGRIPRSNGKTEHKYRSISTSRLNLETGQVSRRPTSTLTSIPTRAVTLACPFYKLNPASYQACARLKLSKISYMKQHLVRQHIVAAYCPRCLETFSSNEDFSAHFDREERCEKRSGMVEGITTTMKEQLSRRADQSASEAEQWCDVWKLLFGREPPASPYIDLDLPEEINWYNDYLLNQMPVRLSEQAVPPSVEEWRELVRGTVSEVAQEWKTLWQQGRVRAI